MICHGTRKYIVCGRVLAPVSPDMLQAGRCEGANLCSSTGNQRDKQDKRYATTKLSRVVGRHEDVAVTFKLEGRRFVPIAVNLVESEGDLELVVLLCHGHLVVVVHVAVVEDVRCLQGSFFLSERCGFNTCQILKQ